MFLIVGPPGSGKSTQAQILQEREGFEWISVGKLAREVKDPKVIDEMRKGELLDNDFVQMLLSNKLDEFEDLSHIIIDGFPRDDEQMEGFIKYIESRSASISAVIHVKLTLETALERLTSRGRLDDQPEIVKKRYQLMYTDEINPILADFKHRGVEIVEIDGNKSIEDVYVELKRIVDVYKG